MSGRRGRDVRHHDAVAVSGEALGVSLERGPDPECIHVEHHAGVLAAPGRAADEGIGGPVRRRHIDCV